ncbi:MAG: hypothetical protein FWG46_07915 [Treponema sp.]|nr:hypothetical protein [Treponema sp.]
MILSELIQRSPIRIFEQSIHGGLKAGEIGVIASLNGVGKTSVLVQLALDKLLQGKKVIHVSFTQHAQYVITWYENIFNEFISRKNLENAGDIKNEVVKNRVLMNFNQEGMSGDQIIKSLRAMIVDGGFNAEAVIVDGFDFTRVDRERIANVKAFAGELGLSVWYSCTVREKDQQYDRQNIPLAIKDFADLIDVVIALEPKPDHIELSVSRDRDVSDSKSLAMRLDPKTLLILER